MFNTATQQIFKNGYYISYLPEGGDGFFTDYSETALVNENPVSYLILKGNHLSQLDKLESYEDCINYIKENKKLMTEFSNKIPE